MGKDATTGQKLLLEMAIGAALSIFFANWVVSIARHATDSPHNGPTGYEQRFELRDTSEPQDLTGQWLGEGSGHNAPMGPVARLRTRTAWCTT